MQTKRKIQSRLTLFIDVLFTMVFVLLIQPTLKGTDEQDTLPGQMSVEIRWDDQCDSDIDLVVSDPNGDVVYFAKPASKVFNLLRDDLGFIHDDLGLNYENVYSRGLIEGEYRVNLLYFRAPSRGECPLSQKVQFKISIRYSAQDKTIVHQGTVVLERERNEYPAISFRLDSDKRVVPGSLGRELIPLITSLNTLQEGLPQ